MTNSPDGSSSEGKFLWSKLLEDVKANTSTKLPPQRCLLVLGDSESGKTTLMSRLQGVEDPKKSYGIEYQFIDVKDEDRDDQTKLGVYILDGNQSLSYLIKYALNDTNFSDTLAMIVVNMQEPWNILESLNGWFSVLKSHCDRLKIDQLDREECRQSLVRHFQEYIDPHNLSSDGYRTGTGTNVPALVSSRRYMNPLHPPALSMSVMPNGVATSPSDANDSVTLPLPEGVLEHNLGIPVIVVVTKTDVMNSLADEYQLTEEHFDILQMHIRKFCLSRGASLFYTSVKEDRNCDLLKRYIHHRIYGFPFIQSAYVVEKDCVFVPTGWDNLKKIKILEENLSMFKGNSALKDCIPTPKRYRTSTKDTEIVAFEEQKFLEGLSRELEKTQNRTTPGVEADVKKNRSPTNRPTATGHASSMKRGYERNPPPTNAGEGVLANFFNSLLKKTNSPNIPGTNTAPLSSTASLSNSFDNDKPKKTNGASQLEVQKSLDVS